MFGCLGFGVEDEEFKMIQSRVSILNALEKSLMKFLKDLNFFDKGIKLQN